MIKKLLALSAILCGSMAAMAQSSAFITDSVQASLGNAGSAFAPFAMGSNYSAQEFLWTPSTITLGGTMNAVAFHKSSGNPVNGFDMIEVYVSDTSLSSVAPGRFDRAGYQTKVFSGTITDFPSGAGYVFIPFQQLHTHDVAKNLMLLAIRFAGTTGGSNPGWTYEIISGYTGGRRLTSANAADTANNMTNPGINLLPTTRFYFGSLITTGTKDKLNQTGRVFPNPVKGGEFFGVYFGQPVQQISARLFDLSGRQVYSQQVPHGEKVFVLTDGLARGTYLLQVSHSQGMQTEKIVVE